MEIESLHIGIIQKNIPLRRRIAMIIVNKFIFLGMIFFLSACNSVKATDATDLSFKYEIVDIKSCSKITYFKGIGHLYSKGVTKEINTQEQFFLKNGDMIYLEKDSLVVIEAPDKSKFLLESNQKKSSYRLRLDASDKE